MARLTKAQAKNHQQAMDLVCSDRELSIDERIFVLNNYDPNASHMTTTAGAFFTPIDIAYEFNYCVDPSLDIVVDLCAGIGMLSAIIAISDWHGGSRPSFGRISCDIKRMICLEYNEDYAMVGKRVLPEADWIIGSVFDQSIISGLKADMVISNPPFGAIKSNGIDTSWINPFMNNSFELNVVNVATKISDIGSFILPKRRTSFDADKHVYIPGYPWKVYKEKTGFELIPGSWDLDGYKDLWNGAKPDIEFVSMERVWAEEIIA